MSCRAVATLLSSRRRRVGGPSVPENVDAGRGAVPGMSTDGCVLRAVGGCGDGRGPDPGADGGAASTDERTGGLGGVGCGGGMGRRGLLTRSQIMASKAARATPPDTLSDMLGLSGSGRPGSATTHRHARLFRQPPVNVDARRGGVVGGGLYLGAPTARVRPRKRGEGYDAGRGGEDLADRPPSRCPSGALDRPEPRAEVDLRDALDAREDRQRRDDGGRVGGFEDLCGRTPALHRDEPGEQARCRRADARKHAQPRRYVKVR